MQEYVDEKSINVAIKTTKVTGSVIFKALKAYLRYRKNKMEKNAIQDERIKGKQSVEELIGQNQGVSSLPVGETGLKDFERIANKYGVDFAIVKDKTVEPVKYTVFFKARDADAIAQVLAEYTAKQMKKQSQNRPSIIKTLKKFKEMLAKMPKREQEKKKEQTR
ncbi:MAG: PcfB family protein [Lachnospiraceae bacterium]|nr:PcfB family protein [Lachnospiraceae bacterium]